MLNRMSNTRRRNCWTKRTELERALVVALVVAAFLLLILSMVLGLYTALTSDTNECPSTLRRRIIPIVRNTSDEGQSCDSQACITSSLAILNQINNDLDPCDNFLAFACKNIPENIESRGQISKQLGIEDSEMKKILTESIDENDHPSLRLQKKMYRTCQNETVIMEYSLVTLKRVFDAVGGWPVLNPTWNEAKFDWKKTIYKIRQLGHAYASLLELNIISDPGNPDRFIYQVSIPEISDVYGIWFDATDAAEFMANVATSLGSSPYQAVPEMDLANLFLQELQTYQINFEEDKEEQRLTVGELQRRESAINWMEFINTIAGPYGGVTMNDNVLSPPEKYLNGWFEIIEKTSKKTLANYIVWKVVQDMLPYIRKQLKSEGVKPRLMDYEQWLNWEDICLYELRVSFFPSPVDIIYLRNILPISKRESLQEIFENIRTELKQVVTNTKWIDSEEKIRAVEFISSLSIVIGEKEDYFDDNIFDSIIVVNDTNDNFLDMLLQLRKNKKDRQYGLINKSVKKSKIQMQDAPVLNAIYLEFKQYYRLEGGKFLCLYIKCSAVPTIYFDVSLIVMRCVIAKIQFGNIENISDQLIGVLEDPYFNENRPNYVNYAIMGITNKREIFNLLKYITPNATQKALERYGKCLLRFLEPENTSIFDQIPLEELAAYNLAFKVSYAAYKKWAETKEELSLIGLHYTPEQLFHMFSQGLFCQDVKQYDDILPASRKPSMFSKVINNNKDLAKDFKCSEKVVKCSIF